MPLLTHQDDMSEPTEPSHAESQPSDVSSRHSRSHVLEARVVDVCDAIGAFIEYWGFRNIHGRVWGFLALSKAPVAQSRISKALGVSRPLVHSAIHELSELGLARAVGEGRSARWEATIDVWPVITDVLRQRERGLIDDARNALEQCIEEAELAAEEGQVPFSIERMKMLLAMTEIASRALRFLVSLRGSKGDERFGDLFVRAGTFIRSLRRR